uniref:Bacterial Ig domain-containing protein n=1 Tax=Streptomyces sp. NBC_00003 TaxID=2903608 RepID=A0AAU2V601_9ACTN
MLKATLRSRCARTFAAGALSAALLTAGAAGTFAHAAAAPKPKPSASASKSAAAITVKASSTSVKAGDKMTFTGRTKGMPIGSKLVLQHKKGNKWTTLQASTTVKKGSGYSLEAKLNDKGKQELRIKYDEVTSPTVTVTVK